MRDNSVLPSDIMWLKRMVTFLGRPAARRGRGRVLSRGKLAARPSPACARKRAGLGPFG